MAFCSTTRWTAAHPGSCRPRCSPAPRPPSGWARPTSGRRAWRKWLCNRPDPSARGRRPSRWRAGWPVPRARPAAPSGRWAGRAPPPPRPRPAGCGRAAGCGATWRSRPPGVLTRPTPGASPRCAADDHAVFPGWRGPRSTSGAGTSPRSGSAASIACGTAARRGSRRAATSALRGARLLAGWAPPPGRRRRADPVSSGSRPACSGRLGRRHSRATRRRARRPTARPLDLRGSDRRDRLLGWHLLTSAPVLETGWAAVRAPSRAGRSGLLVARARASPWSPWVALDDRYRPLPGIELELGLRLEKSSSRREPNRGAGPARRARFAAGLLIAPRAQACYLARRRGQPALPDGRPLRGRGCRSAPCWTLTAEPPGSMSAPAEDAALALGELRLGVVRLAGYALDRRTAARDRGPVLPRHGPARAARAARSRAGACRPLRRRAGSSCAGTRVGAGLVASRLRGNHVGFVDDGTGQLRPAGTAALGHRLGAHQPGRPAALRPPLERAAAARAPAVPGRHDAGPDGRSGAGTPERRCRRRGRSPESGPGQVFLVQRGSLGRTAPVRRPRPAVAGSRGRWPGPRVRSRSRAST